jgi:Ca2+-binding RTX toxin-like protein
MRARVMNSTLGRVGLAAALVGGLALTLTPYQAGAEDPQDLSVDCDDKPDITAPAGGGLTLGTAGPDVIKGSDAGDLIQGMGGDDYICGGGGNDVIFGGDGDDELIGNLGNDMVTGDAGDDEVFGGGGNDLVFGGEDDDYCSGSGEDSDLDVAEKDMVVCESVATIGAEEKEPAQHTTSP